MCGRFYIEPESPTLEDIMLQMGQYIPLGVKTSGDIYPSDIAAVQTGADEYAAMRWGFTLPGGKAVINARSETAGIKPMFCEAMRSRRCLVPASGYYEWKKLGAGRTEKYAFTLPAGELLYMAGLFARPAVPDARGAMEALPAIGRFVILTREAAPELAAIHGRMPVIIPRRLAGAWLRESPKAAREALTDLRFDIAESAGVAQMSLLL